MKKLIPDPQLDALVRQLNRAEGMPAADDAAELDVEPAILR